MAPGSSPALTDHPKMRACSYILQRGFKPPSDSKLATAGPIAVNDPAAKLRELAARVHPRLLTATVDVVILENLRNFLENAKFFQLELRTFQLLLPCYNTWAAHVPLLP